MNHRQMEIKNMTTIPLADYNIFVGTAWDALNELIAKKNYSSIAVIVDENTKKHCLPLLAQGLERDFITIEIPAGELHKNIGTCGIIWEQMMHHRMSRSALTINLGGGVIGDMGGFCASTFKRGMDFIQMPTTLLSQVDASIGGKLGIDFLQVKNSIGIFKNPQAVIVDPTFLNTLPLAELRSGLAEIIKHSLIANADEWEKLQQLDDLTSVDWETIIIPSLYIKQQVVEEDPFEKGLRKALNFGHTIGHALEGYALESDRPLLHGEAIAIGMICEAFLSKEQGHLSEASLAKITDYIHRIYPFWKIPMEALSTFIGLMRNDKKNENAQINFSFLPEIGEVLVNQTASEAQIEASLHYYNSLAT